MHTITVPLRRLLGVLEGSSSKEIHKDCPVQESLDIHTLNQGSVEGRVIP